MSNQNTTPATLRHKKVPYLRRLLWVAVPASVAALCFLAWHLLLPATTILKEDVRTYEGDTATVICQHRDALWWGFSPHLSVEVDPGFIKVRAQSKGKTFNLSVEQDHYLFAVNVFNGKCYVVMSRGLRFFLYSCPLEGGKFEEVPITTLPVPIAYRNITKLGYDEDLNLSPEFVNSGKFLKTETANLWHHVATGQTLYFMTNEVAFDRVKNEFLATRNRSPSP